MQFLNAVQSIFTDLEFFPIPVMQMMVFIIINSLCLLLGRYKLGLMVSYCFVLYWGFVSNREHFIDKLGGTTWVLITYVVAGSVMAVVFIIGIFQSSRD